MTCQTPAEGRPGQAPGPLQAFADRLAAVVRLLRPMFCVLGILALGPNAPAGEKLNFGGAKTRLVPGMEKNAPEGADNAFGSLQAPSPYTHVLPRPIRSMESRKLSKEEKRLQNEQDQRSNWGLLDPGQLQQEEGEEYDFGVREYSADDLEKEDQSRDYTFHGLASSRTEDAGGKSPHGNSLSQAQSRRLSRPGQHPGNGTAQPRHRMDEEEGARPSNLSPNPLRAGASPASAGRLGAHMAPELDLQGMLRGSEDSLNSSPSFSSPNTGLRSLLGGSLSGSDQQQVSKGLDNFREMLNSRGAPGGLSDAVNYPNDLTRQPLNPVTPSPTLGGGNLSGAPFIPGASLSAPTFDSGIGILQGANPSLPTFNQPEEPSRRLYSPPPEMPRRKF